MAIPRIMISAVRGGEGKTILTTGLVSALDQKYHKRVLPFKKGPDYIDAGWLALAAGRPCSNLDTYLISPSKILSLFSEATPEGDIAIIEGNRGLYDGIDLQGDTSSAELSKLLKTPVILSLDASKISRTLAAVVLGCIHFDPDVQIEGVVLNRVANSRHEAVLRKNIEHYCKVPVLGAIPKLQILVPERYMGLVSPAELQLPIETIQKLGEIVATYVDVDHILQIATRALPLEKKSKERTEIVSKINQPVKIGILKDSVFQFYYPENLTALEKEGATLIFTSPQNETVLPDMDALYIGGGFPETQAQLLSKNNSYRESIRLHAEKGLPIYAESGGFMYLGKELLLGNQQYPMCDVLPFTFTFLKKPQGHGYTHYEVVRKNPYLPIGTKAKAHEFHYSSVCDFNGDTTSFVFQMKRGKGIYNGWDGFCYKNVLATHSHIHAAGFSEWAPAFVQKAREYHSLMRVEK